jgi:hypothetical protein
MTDQEWGLMLAQQEWLAKMYYLDPAWAERYRPLIDQFGVDRVWRAWAEASARNIEGRGDGSAFFSTLHVRLEEISSGLDPRDDIEVLSAVDPDLLGVDPHLRAIFSQILKSPIIRQSWTAWRREQLTSEETSEEVVRWCAAIGLHHVLAAARGTGESGQAADLLRDYWSRVSDCVMGDLLGPDYRKNKPSQTETMNEEPAGTNEALHEVDVRMDFDRLWQHARDVSRPREREFFDVYFEGRLRGLEKVEATTEAEAALGLAPGSGSKYMRRILRRLAPWRSAA